MNEAVAASSDNKEAKALIKVLQEKFDIFRDFRPLAIGIDKQILARLPEVSPKILRRALAFHTRSTPYLKGMSNASVRYDLDGNTGEPVPEEHRTYALDLLRTRLKKQSEQRKAEVAQKQEVERRNAKLAALAEKFKR